MAHIILNLLISVSSGIIFYVASRRIQSLHERKMLRRGKR
jgi:hypothetical protein